MPVILTWAFPKFNIILLVSREEQLEVFQNRYWMLLEGMSRWVENSFHHMDWICKNNDFGNITVVGYLIDAASNCEELGFYACDI